MPTTSEWIDISVPITDGMVHWPDNPPVHVERFLDRENGDAANVSQIDMSVHTGTHMDAPVHFVPEGDGIDSLSIDACIGEARVLEFADVRSITRKDLEALSVQEGERLLFKTANSNRAWWTESFHEDFVDIATDAAEYLAERRVRCVGVDYLSVATPNADGERVHRALLESGIVIIEGLNLASVAPGRYMLCCLPVRLAGSDGAPARAVVRPIDA